MYPTKKLSEICKINYWYTESASFEAIGPKFLRITDIQYNIVNWEEVPFCKCDEIEKFRLKDADIVFARTWATTWKSYLISNPPESIFASYLIRLQIKNQNLVKPKYLLYFFQTQTYWDIINRWVSWSAQWGFNATKLWEIQIPLPPLSSQLAIVARLDSAMAEIDEARRQTESALASAREVWESTLESVFAGGGKGWEEKRFDEVCVLQRWYDLPTHERKEGTFALVSSNGITDRIDQYKVKAPWVVTWRSWTIWNVHFIDEDFWPLNTALYIKDFHWNNEKCVFYFLKQFNLGKYSSWAGVPTLNRNNVHCERVSFPPIPEQSRIVAHLDAIRAETESLEKLYTEKLASLDELRRSILQEAFS